MSIFCKAKGRSRSFIDVEQHTGFELHFFRNSLNSDSFFNRVLVLKICLVTIAMHRLLLHCGG